MVFIRSSAFPYCDSLFPVGGTDGTDVFLLLCFLLFLYYYLGTLFSNNVYLYVFIRSIRSRLRKSLRE